MNINMAQGATATEGLAFNSLMHLIKWEENFRLEQPRIDADHKELFRLAEQACRISRTPEAFDELLEVFGQFSQVMKAHFEYEENILERTGYERLDEHRAEHAYMLDEHQLIHQRLQDIGQRALYPEEALVILNFMLETTVGHIRHCDVEYRSVARSES